MVFHILPTEGNFDIDARDGGEETHNPQNIHNTKIEFQKIYYLKMCLNIFICLYMCLFLFLYMYILV